MRDWEGQGEEGKADAGAGGQRDGKKECRNEEREGARGGMGMIERERERERGRERER